MDETIFFNPGDAIARDFDFQAARRSAEIFKVQHAADQGLVVAKDETGKFAVFYEGADVDPEAGEAPATRYTILAHL
ncbi:hypothetical protein [Lacticaseibacillus daqingensis]|uniref:hypothetical protein n=1 Tax=Lacticaseibacillus daqingensis TaxID=2486014 RepID=UPI000F768CA1|nr:hypothetical protein [Lacticaseibacillus daqingensis]